MCSLIDLVGGFRYSAKGKEKVDRGREEFAKER